MKATISGNNLNGAIRPPGSKSFSQRFILFAGADEFNSTIHGVHYSQDEQVALGIIRSEGAVLKYYGDSVTVNPNFSCPDYVEVGESATSYRLSMGILAARKCRTEFRGHPELSRRPVGTLKEVLTSMGAKIEYKGDGFVLLDARDLTVEDAEIDGSKSSQFVSAMLAFYAFGGEKENSLKVKGDKTSLGYVEITIACLEAMGFRIEREINGFNVLGRDEKPAEEYFIERDFSSAAFFLVLGLLASEQGIKVNDLPAKSQQADSVILDLLRKSSTGISITDSPERFEVRASKSVIDRIEIDADYCPDLAPIVGVIGIFQEKGVTIRNPGRLKIKESDRYSETIRLVESFGAEVEAGSDYLHIKKGARILNPGKLSFTDHRMIMSAIIAGLSAGFEIEYENVERINKSYPGFLDDLKRIGALIRLEPVL